MERKKYELSPYAVLMAKDNDTDQTIRKLYHQHARVSHPDATKANPEEDWYVATKAYNAIKTEELRAAWRQRIEMMSGLCTECDSIGVVGSRTTKRGLRVCSTCKGVGRVV